MKIIIHKKGRIFINVLTFDGIEVRLKSSNLLSVFWELGELYPQELIGWCEQGLEEELAIEGWNKIFHHDLIMASYAVNTQFLPNSIGYVDQLPFVNVNRNVLYSTWQMSSDVGGIRGEALLRFLPLLKNIKSLDFLLNSIGKIGQQNGLFCYSAPDLVTCISKNVNSSASSKELFEFVYCHYKTIWTLILCWCYIRYEWKFPFIAYLRTYTKRKFFQKDIPLIKKNKSFHGDMIETCLDVIIPTFGRPNYLENVIKDLEKQSFLPKRVIIIEQNPDQNSITEIQHILEKSWPFDIVHHFIHKVGVCNARNIALQEVNSEWIFFADDDIRLEKDVLKKAVEEIYNYGMAAINLNCKQIGEETTFHKVKQWGGFGSGTSIVKSSYAKQCSFLLIYEHGYGEDFDFGMQLRNLGCDIIYHPKVSILHLKAPSGGFRNKQLPDWEQEKPTPKPSPTIMAFVHRFYTLQQKRGFKNSLFLKYYLNQSIRNPIAYFRNMNIRWEKSETWARELLKDSTIPPVEKATFRDL